MSSELQISHVLYYMHFSLCWCRWYINIVEWVEGLKELSNLKILPYIWNLNTYISVFHTLMDPPSFIYIIHIISRPRVAIQVVMQAKHFDMQEGILVVTRQNMIHRWNKKGHFQTLIRFILIHDVSYKTTAWSASSKSNIFRTSCHVSL